MGVLDRLDSFHRTVGTTTDEANNIEDGFDPSQFEVEPPSAFDPSQFEVNVQGKPIAEAKPDTTGMMVEQFGRGIDREQAGMFALGSVNSSYFDQGKDSTFKATVAQQNPALAKKYEEAYARYRENIWKLPTGLSFIGPEFGDAPNPTEEAFANLSKEDQEAITQFESLLQNERMAFALSRDTSDEIVDWNKRALDNYLASEKPSEYEGLNERVKKVQSADGFGATLSALMDDPQMIGVVAAKNTGENLTGTLVGSIAGAITRSPVLFQLVSSMGNFGAEARGAVFDQLKNLYETENPDKSFLDITPEEYDQLVHKHQAKLREKFGDGMRDALITTAAESIAAKGVGTVAAKGAKLAKADKGAIATALGVSTASLAGLTGEGWEEAFGQITTNLANGKPWDEGVGNSFVMGLLSLEAVPNAVTVGADARNMLSENAPQEEQTASPEAARPTQTTEALDVAQSGNEVEQPAQASSAQTPPESSSQEEVTEAPSDPNTPSTQQQLIDQVVNLRTEYDNPQTTMERKQQIQSELNSIDNNNQEYVDSAGRGIVLQADEVYRQLQTLADLEVNINESRSFDRYGEQNANGAANGQGANALDGSGAQRRGETSEQVSPTKTEATSTGYSQSNPLPPTNFTQQSDDNAAESSNVGLDRRADETNGDGGERGSVGQTGIGQSGDSAQTSRAGSADSGVQQRPQSGSVGEALASYKATVYRGGETEGRSLAWHSTNEKTANTYGEVKGSKEVTFANPQVFDAEGQLFSQIKPALRFRPTEIKRLYPDVDKHVRATMYGDEAAKGNLGKQTDKIVYDALAHNRLVDLGVLDEPKYDGVVIKNIIDPGNKKRANVQSNAELLGDNVITLPETTSEQATKKTPPQRKTDKHSQMVARSNDKLRKIEQATAPRLSFGEEVRAKLTNKDLRSQQREARALLTANPSQAEDIKVAFLDVAASNHKEQSWNAVERGYLMYSAYNPTHKKFKGSTEGLLGFDFDGNAVYDTNEQIQKALLESDTAEALTVTAMAQLDSDTSAAQTARVVARTFMKKLSDTEHDMIYRTVEDYYDDGTGSSTATTQDIINAVADNDFMEYVRAIGGKVKDLFTKLQKVVSGIIAVVAVGSMVVPSDAVAQQGMATYSQGITIQGVSQEVSNTANWVKDTSDHQGKNFIVADKDGGKIHVFSPDGKLLNTQNALFGKNKGNDNSFGNTPSGRFQLQKQMTSSAQFNNADRSVFGDSVLSLSDPETKAVTRAKDGRVIAMHRVVNKAERKAALNSATASDNFMSHGCINLPTAFYDASSKDLDGAMVYVLDHKTAKPVKVAQQVKATKGRVDFGNVKRTQFKLSTASDMAQAGIKQARLDQVLGRALGDLAANVQFIQPEQATDVQGYQPIATAGIEGFFDPETNQVYILADNIRPQHGLNAEQRIAWVAWHELTHRGLVTQYSDKLNTTLDMAMDNDTILDLALAIADERSRKGYMDAGNLRLATEEALAELNAARMSANFAALEDRYGVTIPNELRGKQAFFSRVMNNLKAIARDLLGLHTKTSNKQINDLLSNLALGGDVAILESRQLSADLLEKLNAPDSVYQGVKLSIGGSVLTSIDGTYKSTKQVIRNWRNQRASSSTGRNPNDFQVGVVVRDESTEETDAVTDTIEAMIDSQIRVTQALGGTLSTANLEMKKATNKMAQKQTEFNKQTTTWADKVVDYTMALRKRINKGREEKLFQGKEGIASMFDTIQHLASARYAITGGNNEIRETLEQQIEFLDETYTNLLEGITNLGELSTQWQREQLAKIGKERDETRRRLQTHGELLNRIIQSEYDHKKDKLTIHPDAEGRRVIVDELTNQAGEVVSVNKSVSREDMAYVDGSTNAEAYLTITKIVKLGLVDVKVKGEPWLDYIARIGFSEEKGFADKSKDYTLSEADIEMTGELAGLMDEAIALQHSHRSYLDENYHGAFNHTKSSNRYAVATSGKVDVIRTAPIKQADGSIVYRVQEQRSIEEQLRLEEVAQWQNQRQGRSFTGGNMLQQLNYTSNLAVRTVAMENFGKELEKIHREEPKRVRKILSTSPYFDKVDGVIMSSKDPRSGKVTTYKLSFRDLSLNDALFGKNVKNLGSDGAWNVFDGTIGLLSGLTRWASVMYTSFPVWSVYNAWKGFKEKFNWLAGMAHRSAVGKELGIDGTWFGGTKAYLNMRLRGFKHFVKYMMKYAVTPPQYNATLQFARYLNSKGKPLEAFRPKVGYAQRDFDRIVALYESGAITHRADMVKADNRDLANQIPRSWFGRAYFRPKSDMASTLLTYTSSMELVSTLAFTDTLKELGVSDEQASGLNLVAMNFNDKGASRFSAYIRAIKPFANATAQGAKSTVQAYATRTGWYLSAERMALGLVVQQLLSALADQCEDLEGRNAFDNINSYEVGRNMLLYNGCTAIKLPIEFGSGMIDYAVATAASQRWNNHWSTQQSLTHILDTIRENTIPLPTGTLKGGFAYMLLDTFIPHIVAKYWRTNAGYSDFYNRILPFGTDATEDNLAYKNKPNTDPRWVGFAKEMDGLGFNWSGEQWSEFSKILVDGNLRKAVKAGIEVTEGKGEEAWWALGKALLGGNSAYDNDQDQQDLVLRRIYNALEKHNNVYDFYVKATTVKSDLDGDGEENDRISLGSGRRTKDQRKAIAFRNQMLEQAKDKFGEDKGAVFEVMVEYGIAMSKAKREGDLEARNEAYNRANLAFLHALDEVEGKK